MDKTASSPYLNRPLRSEAEVRAQLEHGPAFCRQVLDGAFERVYIGDGEKFVYRDMNGQMIDPATLKPIMQAAE